MRKVQGFTLVELVVVIAILAILAATAIPRFVDLSGNARTAAANGIAAAIASGGAVNYAAHLSSAGSGVNVLTCSLIGSLVQGGLPTGTSVGGAAGSPTNGTPMSCTVEYSASGGTATVNVSVLASSA